MRKIKLDGFIADADGLLKAIPKDFPSDDARSIASTSSLRS